MAKRRRELISHPTSLLVRFATLTPLCVRLTVRRARQVAEMDRKEAMGKQDEAIVKERRRRMERPPPQKAAELGEEE